MTKSNQLRNLCKSRETYCTLYSETNNLKSILLKAALQKNKTSRKEAKCNMSTFTSDGNARMQTVLRDFVCLCEQLSRRERAGKLECSKT